MTDFGTDFALVDDLDTTLSTVSGGRIVAEAVARRYQTPTGRLIGDPNYGFDLTAYCNADVTPADIDTIERGCVQEAEKDERVASAEASVSLAASGVLTVTVNLTLITGETFELVLAITDVTVELLSVE